MCSSIVAGQRGVLRAGPAGLGLGIALALSSLLNACEGSRDSDREAPLAIESGQASDRAIRRLPADSFSELPAQVVEGLERLDCRVPQRRTLPAPHNVVSGQFAAPGQRDWAFLCSEDGVSSIHLLWGGPATCETPVRTAPDRSYLQSLGGDTIGFSRKLGPIDRERILRYAEAFGGPPVPDVRYQGIEDYFEGKASTVLLCVEGEWVVLQGID